VSELMMGREAHPMLPDELLTVPTPREAFPSHNLTVFSANLLALQTLKTRRRQMIPPQLEQCATL
jgi:hypothetical protein